MTSEFFAQFHPALSSVPVVFSLAALFSLIASNLASSQAWLSFANRALLLAVVVSPVTYLTGYITRTQLIDSPASIEHALISHQNAAFLFMCLLCVAGLLQLVSQFASHARNIFRRSAFCMLAMACGVGLITGFRGGKLVFTHGVGVQDTEQLPVSLPTNATQDDGRHDG